MTEQQKLKYIELALAIQHIHLKPSDLEKILKTYELIQTKGGEANLKDIAKITTSVEAKDKIDF